MDARDWITVPTSEYAELAIATVPREADPADDLVRSLSDPNNYTHVLDLREFEERTNA